MHPCPCLFAPPLFVPSSSSRRGSTHGHLRGPVWQASIASSHHHSPIVTVSFSPSSSSTITALILSLAMSLALQLSTAKQCRRADAILSGTKRAMNDDKRVGQQPRRRGKARCIINEGPGRHCAATTTAQCIGQHRTRHEMTHLSPNEWPGTGPDRENRRYA